MAHSTSCSVCTRILSRQVKRPGLEVDYLLPSSTEVENGWNYTYAVSTCVYAADRDSFTFAHLFFDLQAVTEKNCCRGAAPLFVLWRSHVQILLRITAVISAILSVFFFLSPSSQIPRQYLRLGH